MKKAFAYAIASLMWMSVFAQKPLKDIIQNNFKLAISQYTLLDAATPADKMPRTFANGTHTSSDLTWWTSGFFPGSLWLIYEQTKDENIKTIAEKRLAREEKMQRFTGNHDIGFMIFCSFGNAFRITGNPHYKQVIDTAAFYQITRYRPSISSIQSWNAGNVFSCPVIIDNMMNLEQLCWVAKESNMPAYRDIAVKHANTTLKNHYRPDNSAFHVVDYDLATGNVIQKKTHQGYSDASAWSRGQSWGLYGFTMMYRFTKDKKYLQQAEGIANFLIHHPNMPADGIPYWDYDAPVTDTTYRDASAAAIMASALLELADYSKNKKTYNAAAEKIIRSLSSPAYLAAPGSNGGFLLQHNVGSLPHRAEVDMPLTYADYYFLEAMARYLQRHR